MVSQEGTIDAGLKALADTTRRGILALLKGQQLSVLEIAEEFPMSRPAISKHLRILKEAGLVLETPSGRQRLYALESAPLRQLTAWLAGLNGVAAAPSSRVGSRAASAGSARSGSRYRPYGGAGDWRVW